MVQITYECDRIGCEAVESVEESGGHLSVDEFMPDGWGWDFSNVDEVLHCPEHRSEAPDA